MAVALPAVPKEAGLAQRLLDFGAMMKPPLGGAGQYVARLGARFALDVELPVLDDAWARLWIAARMKAKAEGATLTLAWPQVAAPAMGAPTVSGAGQAGTVLNVAGLTAGVVVPPMMFFSFIANGRHYLHATTSQVVASGGGTAALTIAPMLRYAPPNAAALEFAAPVIEGYIEGDTDWTLERLIWRKTSFTLSENE